MEEREKRVMRKEADTTTKSERRREPGGTHNHLGTKSEMVGGNLYLGLSYKVNLLIYLS